MNFAKARMGRFLNFCLVVLLGATALSFGAKISPLTFGNDATDDATWLRLVQYKLWATGSDGITIKSRAHITDTTGYIGSAQGGLTYENTDHALGGPLVFAGPFTVYDGQDTIVNGPSRFSSMQFTNYTNWNNGKQNVINGKFCLTNGGTCPNNVGPGISCTCDGVPSVDSDLKLPTVVPNFVYDVTIGGFHLSSQDQIYYIDVPPGEGPYNILINGDITLQNGPHLIVRMPHNGRSTRIIVNGKLTLYAKSHIRVMYADESENWRGAWAKTRLDDAASIKDYAGDLLFYLKGGFQNDAFENGDIVQGTYIVPGSVTINQHLKFAGQILADKIIIEHDFNSEFRYVPFEGPKVDTKAIAKGALYEGHESDTIKFSLTEPAAVKVSFKYCYDFEKDANENTLKSDKSGVITAAHQSDFASENLPLCSKNQHKIAHFKEDSQISEEVEIVTANDDVLTENQEYFYLYIYDVDGAVLDNGKRSDSLKIYIYDNDDKAMGKDTTITSIILNNKDSIGYEDVSFAITSFPAFSSSDGIIQGSRLTEYQVKIVSLPTAGTLKIRGKEANVGDVVSSADLKNSQLTFVSAPNVFGDPSKNYAYSSFEFLILNKNGVEAPDPKIASIQMLPVNDAPEISSIYPVPSYTGDFVIDRHTFRFNENLAKGTLIGVTDASDVDALLDSEAKLTYSFGKIVAESGYEDASKAFIIDEKTGKISINDNLSYNKKAQKYKGLVVVTDNGVVTDRKNVLKDTMTFYIELLEVPHKPEIVPNPNKETVVITEHSEIGSIIMQYKAVDENQSDALTLSYKLDALSPGTIPFTIDSVARDSAVVKIAENIDYETMPNIYRLRVIVSDNKDEGIALYDTVNLTIFVKDTNEAPEVEGASFMASDADKNPKVIGSVLASDVDTKATPATTLTYSMPKIYDTTDPSNKKDASSLFDINSNGEVYVKSASELGVELQNHKFEGEVVVTDNGVNQNFCYGEGASQVCEKGVNLSSKTTIFISIPEHNYEPKFDSTKYTFSIKENSLGGTKLEGFIGATDANKDNLTFAIMDKTVPFELYSSGENKASFQVKQNVIINFETKNQYTFKVSVSDGSGTDYTDIIINVEDVNENPKIAGNNFYIKENAAIGDSVGVVKVSDEDTWTNMSYALSDSTKDAAKLFKIEAMQTCDAGYHCGKLVVNTNKLDFEAQQKHVVYVKATDNGSQYGLPPSLSDSTTFSIFVENENEPPQFEKDEYIFSVNENTEAFSDVGDVHANDKDALSIITYSMIEVTPGVNTFFEISEETGEIQVINGNLDHETLATYQLKVVATDNGNPKLKDTASVTIIVNDVNEDPTLIAPEMEVNEWAEKGKVIGRVTSDDLDTAFIFKKHKYFAIGGDTLLFAIDSLTGEVSVKDTIFDSTNELLGYSLDVRVVDYSTDILLFDRGDVIIKLNHVNDPPALGFNRFFVSENASAGEFVGDIPALDDSDDYEDLKFEIVGNSDEFELSKTVNGRIVVKSGAKIDYEQKQIYEILIRVKDSQGDSTEGKFNVFVKNLNEPPVFDNTEFAVLENSPAGYTVGKVTATDSEDESNKLVFEFDSLFVSDEFELSSSGSIRVKAGANLDFEKQQVYTLQVKVTDKDSASTLGEVTIRILNVNELPVFEKNEFHIPENSIEKTVVGHLVASDAEDDASDLIYSLVGASLEFEVAKNGTITVKKGAQLDYETTPEYAIKVSVKDLDGDSTIGTIKIYIDDVREAPTLADTTLHISENVPEGTKVGVLVPNNPEKDTVKFKLITTTDKFKVRDDGTIITTGDIDYENKKEHKIKVEITGDDGSLDTATVTIVVDNIIEQPVVEITRADNSDSIWINPDTIYTNKEKIVFEWTMNKKYKPDTIASFPKNGTHVFALCYEDVTMDLPGCDTVIVKMDNSIPNVRISKSAEDTAKITGVTIVEQVAEDDSVFYVNHEDNVVRVRITDNAMGIDSAFNVDLRLDSISSTKKSLDKVKKLSETKITLDDAEKAETRRTAFNSNLDEVSFKRLIGGDTVIVTYYTDKKGKTIKNSDGDVIMTLSYNVVINGKPAKVSYNVNGETGEIVENVNGGTYEFSYSYIDKFGGVVAVRYSVDKKGNFTKTDVGDLGYQVSYTYKNRYGNTATKNIMVVVDKIIPVVKIISPADGIIVKTTGVDVKWTVDGKLQDTLVIQGLKNGINTIVRTYRDKAGNEASDSVDVYLKSPKELDVRIEKPVTVVDADSVHKYYDVNPPREGQSYAVSMYNPYKEQEIETLVGGTFGKEKGSKKEAYPGMKGHLGPTLLFDALAPRCGDKTAGGLCTLDDIIERDGLVSLEAGGGWDRKKVSVDEYARKYCSNDFLNDYQRYGASKTNLYNTKLHVTIWIYTNLGGFLNKYSFVQEINDPDYVSPVGDVNMAFELKPDMDGNVIAENGRLIGTGAYIFSTEVKSVSELRCKLPDEDLGHKRYVTEDLRKPFGYKRPIPKKEK